MDDRVLCDGVSVGLPVGTPSTLEESVGRPSVRRFFPGGPAVYALTVGPTGTNAVDAVQSAAGDVVAAYRVRPGFSRTSRPTLEVAGAEEALLLDFEWEDSRGVTMRSLVVVAANADRFAVLHGALPMLHGPDAAADTERVLRSLDLTPTDRGDS